MRFVNVFARFEGDLGLFSGPFCHGTDRDGVRRENAHFLFGKMPIKMQKLSAFLTKNRFLTHYERKCVAFDSVI